MSTVADISSINPRKTIQEFVGELGQIDEIRVYHVLKITVEHSVSEAGYLTDNVNMLIFNNSQ